MSDAYHRPVRHPALRVTLLVTGVILILLTPIVGPIPGPGGIFVFAAGLTLILRNSLWARRRFAKAKRRWPRLGRYADKGLRRRSARRRHERDVALGLHPPKPSLWRRVRDLPLMAILFALNGDQPR
jgi:hypothetical protein